MDIESLQKAKDIEKKIEDLKRSISWCEYCNPVDGLESDHFPLFVDMNVFYKTASTPFETKRRHNVSKHGWLRIIEVMLCEFRDELQLAEKELEDL